MTLTLDERIRWLHGEDGPRGRLSHDVFAEILGTSRQVVIGWEKPGGKEPSPKMRKELARFSLFPEAAFSRRLAEVPAAATIRLRLEELAEVVARGFFALGVTPAQLQPSEEEQSPAEEAR